MVNGLYEKLLVKSFRDSLDGQLIDVREIDSSESARVVATEYFKLIRDRLSKMKPTDRIEFTKSLNKLLESDEFEISESKFMELLTLHEDDLAFNKLREFRPRTSIATSTLFTGFSGPSLESELKREIRTADRIDLLVSFIKFSGLRLIIDELRGFTKNNKLRIITTSYMGASDFKAIQILAELPNTEIRISYDTKRTRLHAKAYYFERETGFSTAYIGSSNISNPALSSGLEWNLKVSEYTSKDVTDNIKKTFETYWHDEEFRLFSLDDKEHIVELKRALEQVKDNEDQLLFFDINLYSHQKEILESLQYEREVRNSYRNLVVAATGTGKTMVAAFDYKNQVKKGSMKLLFLAHRKEILTQSLMTFRTVLRDQNFGELWVDGSTPDRGIHIFASIQSITSNDNFRNYPKNYFDYIVIDETHHSAADTYLRVLSYYEPYILLGLTATPERMDNQDILRYFNNRIAAEIRLGDAISRKLLCPFHYFGVSDPIDIKNLHWIGGRYGGYDISELENVYTKSNQRVQTIIKAIQTYLKDSSDFKSIGYCASIRHADFMSKSFNAAGIRSVSFHSESPEEIRNDAIRLLKNGEIKCIFAVDKLNEGVDIPEIDTVLFLRPTESLTVFIQQLGRGLRLSEGKDVLTVLDFVGQAHANYDFSSKFRAMLGKNGKNLKEQIIDEFPNLPAGCHIKLEEEAQEHILENIHSAIITKAKLVNMITNFRNITEEDLNISNFFEIYGVDKAHFYSKYSFYALVAEAGLKTEYSVNTSEKLKNALRRASQIDSRRLLEFSRMILSTSIDLDSLLPIEIKMLGMLYYTIWDHIPDEGYSSAFEALKLKDPLLVKELIEIIDLKQNEQGVVEISYEDESVPIDVYASYTSTQILAALGKVTEKKNPKIREGVLFIKEKNTDLFFITINKMEKDYLPSTMYNDYALGNEFFHWESQSTTSISSPTGQRYINDKSQDHKILFFVREYKVKYGNTSTYRFLGNAKYVSHKGSNPIQILWKMDHPIPETIIRESDLKLAK